MAHEFDGRDRNIAEHGAFGKDIRLECIQHINVSPLKHPGRIPSGTHHPTKIRQLKATRGNNFGACKVLRWRVASQCTFSAPQEKRAPPQNLWVI